MSQMRLTQLTSLSAGWVCQDYLVLVLVINKQSTPIWKNSYEETQKYGMKLVSRGEEQPFPPNQRRLQMLACEFSKNR